ncbi:MAG: class B sortase [Oscillospiraceae bacterium]|nr:class B sortase [Oscillospiraceae bacterium]
MKDTFRIIATVALVTLLIASLYALAMEVLEMRESKRDIERVYRTLEEAELQKNSEESPEEEEWVAKYIALAEENAEFFGWIHVDGTDIDLPVMHSPERPGYYLKHSFWGKYSDYGTPYLDERCVPDISNNYVVYGHNMRNGTMFAQLHRYESEEFWEEHPHIQFDTLTEKGTYEIFSVFHFDAEHEGYWFNAHTCMGEMEVCEFLREALARQLYETGIEPVYGDQFLTLCTCDRTYRNGRFFVLARKVVT